MTICKYCLKQKQLIGAHILPKKFYTGYEKSGYGLLNSKGYTRKKYQSGVIDNNILCSDCDNTILGEYDKEAYRLLLNIEAKNIRTKWQDFDAYIYNQTEFNYEKLRKFFIAFLWKASISKLECMNMVDLGPYETIALKLLKDEMKNDNLFKIIIAKSKNKVFDGCHSISQNKNVLGQGRIYTVYFDAFTVLIFINYKKFPTRLLPLEQLFLSNEKLIIIESETIDKYKLNYITKFKDFC